MPMMLIHYFPTGLLGPGADGADGLVHVGHGRQRDGLQHRLDLRHLPELHRAERHRPALSVDGPDRHGLRHRLSASAAAYVATQFNNIMDVLQLVFGFVNAPLFATFLLGHVLAAGDRARGVLRPALRHAGGGVHHGLTLPDRRDRAASRAASSRADDRRHAVDYRSEMAQNFWTAIWAFCVVLRGDHRHLPGHPAASGRRAAGLVYSLTPQARRRPPALVQAAGRAGHRRAGADRRPEHHLLVSRGDTPMNLDIRFPIGGLFAIIGVMLVIFGAVTTATTCTPARWAST